MTFSHGETSGVPEYVADALACVLIVAALLVAVRTTRGLERPYDPDHYRDIAQAQTALDGHPLSDQNHRGEWIWYSPLLPWTLALGAAITGVPLETLHVQAGPFLNLLGPIGLYLLAVRLTRNRFAALLALVFYLCAFGRAEPGAVSATYSPWLFASNFAQGLFCLTLIALLNASQQPTPARAVAAGVGVGITFLAHTAPGLLAAAVAVAVLPWTLLAIAGTTAAIVASPFLASIVGHYHLTIVAADPTQWNGLNALRPEAFAGTIVRHAGWLLLSAVGLVQTRSRAAFTWIIAALALTALGVYRLVSVVPASHFWIYSRMAMAVLSGAGVAWLVRRPVFALAVLVGVVGWAAPGYATRAELVDGRAVALKRNPDHSAAARYLRGMTKPEDVVLGTYGAVNLIIGPAGRKTVAAGLLLANPYIDVRVRELDRERMLRAIGERDRATFDTLARRYQVAAMVLVGANDCLVGRAQFTLAYQRADVCNSHDRSLTQ